MTEPAENSTPPAGDEPLPNAPHATPEQRARAREWARGVLARRTDPDDTAAVRAQLGLQPRARRRRAA